MCLSRWIGFGFWILISPTTSTFENHKRFVAFGTGQCWLRHLAKHFDQTQNYPIYIFDSAWIERTFISVSFFPVLHAEFHTLRLRQRIALHEADKRFPFSILGEYVTCFFQFKNYLMFVRFSLFVYKNTCDSLSFSDSGFMVYAIVTQTCVCARSHAHVAVSVCLYARYALRSFIHSQRM